MDKTIEIPMEEYKELLMIKGRYEELKSQKANQTITNGINWNHKDLTTNPNITLL